jgi:hypothetical protein
MRPIDFISQLEETIAESFVRNTLKWRGVQAGLDWLNEDNPRWIGGNQIIFGGFPWSASDEGRKFWNAICGLYGRKSYYPLTEQDLAEWSNITAVGDETDEITFWQVIFNGEIHSEHKNYTDAFTVFDRLKYGEGEEVLGLREFLSRSVELFQSRWVLNRGQHHIQTTTIRR